MNHFYRNIPGWFSFPAIYEAAVKDAHDGAHFVEVGSWKGRSAAFMCVEIINSGKRIRFDCVDTWEGSATERHQSDPAVINGTLYQEFLKNLYPAMPSMRFPLGTYRMPSVEAAEQFKDASLDFIMIDGAHDYESASADIAAWWPKLKPGGTMAGDDFRWKGVNKAVLEAFQDPETVLPGRGKGCHWRVRK